MHKGPKRILIVDDELMILKVLRRFLLNEGFVTYEASDAGAALRLFEEAQPFYALLCDVFLGSIDGWKLARQIYLSQPSIRIIMLSGASGHDSSKLTFKHTLLLKPFGQAELREALEEVEEE